MNQVLYFISPDYGTLDWLTQLLANLTIKKLNRIIAITTEDTYA